MERLVLRLAPPMVSNKMRTHDLDAVDQARLYSPYSTVLGNTGKLPGYYYCISRVMVNMPTGYCIPVLSGYYPPYCPPVAADPY